MKSYYFPVDVIKNCKDMAGILLGFSFLYQLLPDFQVVI